MEINKIIEEAFLETYVDIALGEIKAENFGEVEVEIRRRILQEHKIDLKEKKYKNVLSGIKFETVSPLEISKSLHEFIVEKYIPETSDLRNALLSKLSKHDRDLIKLQRAECSEIIKMKLDENINILNGKEREMKEVLRNTELLNPSPYTIQRHCPKLFKNITQISNKISDLPEEYVKLLYELKREKVKIRLGKFGNLMSTGFGFAGNENKDQINIIELLMIE